MYCVAVGSPSKVEEFVGNVTSGSSTSAQGGIIEPLADESEAFMRMLGMNMINADKPQLKCHRWDQPAEPCSGSRAARAVATA